MALKISNSTILNDFSSKGTGGSMPVVKGTSNAIGVSEAFHIPTYHDKILTLPGLAKRIDGDYDQCSYLESKGATFFSNGPFEVGIKTSDGHIFNAILNMTLAKALDKSLGYVFQFSLLKSLIADAFQHQYFISGGGDYGVGINAPFTTVTVPPVTPPTVQTTAVVKLKDATVIGQKVLGSTPGSIYRVVALNKRVKLAAKWGDTNIHFRVEANKATITEMEAIKKYFTWYDKKQYGSVHFSNLTEEIPVRRVAGAFIMGMGIDFEAQVRKLEDAQ